MHTTHSFEETRRVASQVANRFLSPDSTVVFLLRGDLAAGKTQFAAGIGESCGVEGVMSSPSYVLCREYTIATGTLFHLDLWRLESVIPEQLGIPEMLKPGNVVVVEWEEKLDRSVFMDRNCVCVEVLLRYCDETTREVTVTSL